MAANVEEAEAQVEAAAVAEHLKEECMESMRRVMESVEGVFAAERANQVGKARGNRRDGWSVKYARVITRVRDMIAAAHKTVGAVGATLLRYIGVVNSMANKLEISMDCSKLGEREAARAIKKAGKQLLSGVQGRHRKKWRREMGKRTRNVDRHRQQGQYKRYINSALMRDNGKGLSPWLVVEEEKEGEGGRRETVRRVVEGADAHKAHKASWMERWMSRNGLEQQPKWMEVLLKGGAKLMSPFCSDTVQGREIRERVLAGDEGAAEGTVPTEFSDVLRAGSFKTYTRKGRVRTAKDATEYATLMDVHTKAEFVAAVRGKSNKSAPGASGLSYAELQSCDDEVLGVLSDVCNLSAESGLIFPMWAKEIVYMIPKETGVDLLTKMRPLKLQEALKKVTVGIKKDRMVNAWQRMGLCDEQQYAFLKGRSTVQPAMIKRLVLEQAAAKGTPLAMVDIDFSKAYDTVDRFVKEYALRRMGVGYEFIDYLLEYDRMNVQHVRTSYGDSDAFHCERGVVPQGGIESCFVFVAVVDWLLEVVKRRSESPFAYEGEKGKTVEIMSTVFADDVSLYQSTGEGVQQVMDGVLLFCGLTGMRCNVDKTRWLTLNGAVKEGEGIYGRQWFVAGWAVGNGGWA
jgi:hypothetical protein